MLKNKVKKMLLSAVVVSSLFQPLYSEAASIEEDIDAQIKSQQEQLSALYKQKETAKANELSQRIYDLEVAISKQSSYDVKSAVTSFADQLNILRQELATQAELIQSLFGKLEEYKTIAQSAQSTTTMRQASYNEEYNEEQGDERTHYNSGASRFLVKPAESEEVNYTQDAINAQGNSTMIFKYSPEQLYKIYCRRGFLTDLAFKKGEEITFVGGGDTSGWAVNSTQVDGTPHLYIKPVVETSSTNLIVTTTKHSYQLILNTSDWYNPMVRWAYDTEEQEGILFKKKKDERITTGNLKVSNVDQLDFDYEVSGGNDSNRPIMVFSDGTQTFIKFSSIPARQYPLFIRERGKREMKLVNYRIKDNFIIVEADFSMAEFKLDEKKKLTIKHK